MDTNEYETFEYLQSDNIKDTDQLYVLQDDGTFLSINRPIEFVTQVQNVENVLQEVQPEYNVTPQEIYVDVNSPTELIAVPDEFIIPTEINTIYSNNYLLQENTEASEIQIDHTVDRIPENVVDKLIIPDITAPININNNVESDNLQNNGFTEITITDDQYKLLQRKGWILLETNEKIYLIDNSGLHDITDNIQLVQKLRAELLIDNGYTQHITSKQLKQNISIDGTVNGNSVVYVTENSDQVDLQSMGIQTYSNIREDPLDLQISQTKEVPDLMPLEKEFLETTINELAEKYEKSDPRINNNTIKIKTKFSLKEIPSEITLGKTVNGKKLIARITKKSSTEEDKDSSDTNSMAEKRKPKQYPTISAFHPKIEKMIQQVMRGNINVLSEEEIAANTDNVIQQLLRVPAFKPAVLERKLIITKIIIVENADQTSSVESEPMILTGRVLKNYDKWTFQYMPDMLQRIRKEKANEKNLQNQKRKIEDNDMSFIQIHIQEIKSPDGVARILITLNKRVILLKPKKSPENQLKQEKQKASPKLNPVYACTVCAAVFKTEYRLRLHQQTHKMDFDFESLLEINNRTGTHEPYNTLPADGQKKEFVCNECQYKTTRLSMMHRHIKSHFRLTAENPCVEDSSNSQEKTYKCKMCFISFSHASTFSKHILTKHIKVS